MNQSLKSIIAKAPHLPGIYKFFSGEGDLIYVGKAKDLRKRLQSYVRPSAKHGIKNQKMLEAAESVEWVETNSDMEALILEDNLIKENQPKYNVLLKDSKTFQYIKVTIQKEYPELLTVRRIERDGAKYFGPKTSGMDVQRIVESARRILNCVVKRISPLIQRVRSLKEQRSLSKSAGQPQKGLVLTIILSVVQALAPVW